MHTLKKEKNVEFSRKSKTRKVVNISGSLPRFKTISQGSWPDLYNNNYLSTQNSASIAINYKGTNFAPINYELI